MHVQAGAGGMNPDAIAVVGDGTVGGLIDHGELLVGEIGKQFADVEVEVALRALFRWN